MNTLTLKLEGKVIELALHKTDAGMLYKAQDLLKGGLDLTTKQASKKLENWKKKGNYPQGGVVYMEGRNGGTYFTQDNIFNLAAEVSESFRQAVYEAFTAAAQGDGKAAVDIATSVAIPQELLDREKVLRLQMNTLLDIEAGEDSRKRANLYTNFNRLIAKGVSGYTPTELTGGDVPTFKYIIEKGHKGGVSAYLATMELIITGLFAKLDYHTIALMLRVETGKNKETIGQLK
jgi:hypothetical protein